VSRFFKQTQKANGGAADPRLRKHPVLDVEKLLETIHQGVEEQYAGIEAPSASASVAPGPVPMVPRSVEAVLDAVHDSPAVACGVEEFTTEKYHHVRVARLTEKAFYPEREITPTPPALEAYRTFRTRLLRLQARRHFRTLAISSAAQGDGKTLTAFNLALCCAELPQFPILLVDGDLRTRGVSRLVGLDGSPGLAEVLEGRLSPEKSVLATDIPNFHVMPSGDALKSPPELFSGPSWKQFVVWCQENFKLVIVDSPPVLPLADFDLISAACEGVLLVVRARATDREAFQRVLAHVDGTRLLGVALNSVARSDHKAYEYYYYASKK